MARGEFTAALPYLEKITNGHMEGERDLRIGECAFETGDYELRYVSGADQQVLAALPIEVR